MRVDVVTSSRELFGSDRSAVRLASLLRSLGCEPRIVVPAARPERGLRWLAGEHGIETVEARVVVASRRGIAGASMRAPRLPKADLTIFNTSAVVACSGAAPRRVLVLREWLEPRSIKHRLLVWHHARRATRVVAISVGVAEQWTSVGGAAADSVAVIPNWLTSEWLRDNGRREARQNGIVCVGRFNSWKGQDELARAYTDAFGGSPERPKLTFLGAETEGPFAVAASRLAAEGRKRGWTVEPFTSNPVDTMRANALLVVPSLRAEPFGNVLLEGIASGCKVIAFEGGGPSDLARLFPETIRLVRRDRLALSQALSTWWREGGNAQEPAEHATNLARLRAGFTERAALDRWREVVSP